MTTPFLVPWHVRVLRLFLPQAPGTDTVLYKKMMAAVVSKIEHPYRTYLREMKKQQHVLSGDVSMSAVLTKDIFHEPQSLTSDSLGGAHTEVYCRGSIPQMMALYEAWEWYVRSVVPAHRLIVFEIGKDSWEQLSSALNISIPRINPHTPADPVDNPPPPFPFVNTTSDYYTMMMGQRLLACLLIVSLSLSVTLAVVAVWYCCCRARRRHRDAFSDEFYRELYHGDENEDVDEDDIITSSSSSSSSGYKED